MNKRMSIVLTSLMVGIALVACGPSQAELDTHATEVAASIFETQTAMAPTSTITPTVTPTLTPTPTLIVQIDNVEIHQACQHTTMTMGSGEKEEIKSGLLNVRGEVQIKNTSPDSIPVEILPVTITNVGEEVLCSLSEVNHQTHEWEQITFDNYAIQGHSSKTLGFDCLTDAPLPGMSVIFPSSLPNNIFVIIPTEVEPFSIVLLSEPLIQENATQVLSTMFDVVEFKIAITNNSNATWKFDYEEVIRAVDDKDISFVLAKPERGCPQISIPPGERQELTLLYLALDIGKNPHLEFFTPLSTNPLPSQ